MMLEPIEPSDPKYACYSCGKLVTGAKLVTIVEGLAEVQVCPYCRKQTRCMKVEYLDGDGNGYGVWVGGLGGILD